ncbi:MAG TPA: ATP-binding protein [Labilithrix sp.]|nr:ATP-binding protein [Labilithrix sp.]
MKASDEPVERASILLVDDHPTNLLSLEAVLSRPDYDLVRAASGPEALAAVLRREFAVILLDVAMPRMDGFETAALIKDREQSMLIPIIFITASVYDMEHVFRGYSVGAVDYLLKPINPHALRAKVAVFVELYRQRKKIEAQAERIREAELAEERHRRERVESAFRESEALYQHTFEEAAIGIGHATPEGAFLSVNQRLCEILATDRSELYGRQLQAFAQGEDAASIAQSLATLDVGQGSYHGEHRLTNGRGTQVWVTLTLSALRTSVQGDDSRHVIVVVDDVSERKELELERSRLLRELRDGIQARDNFLSIAAHELKTPITPLRLQTASIVRHARVQPNTPISRDGLHRRLDSIDKAAERLEALIDRLLDVSLLSVGKLTLERETVDLGALLNDVVARLRRRAEREGSSLTADARAAVVGSWDRLRLEQVVTSLLANAIKYGSGKPVEARVDAEADVARITVRDHGIGMSEEAQARIFDRFARAEPVRHFGGFGLGLWTVRRLIEAHGGRVSVRSRPGEGAEFTVELPLSSEVTVWTPSSTRVPRTREEAHA